MLKKNIILSRDEALRYAEAHSTSRVMAAIIIFFLCLFLSFFFITRGEYLLAVVMAGLMILAIFVAIKQSRYTEVYREERIREN